MDLSQQTCSVMSAFGSDNMPSYNKIMSSWDKIWDNSKLIQDKEKRKRFKELLNEHKPNFLTKPSAVKYHHNYEGGLVVHTAQVMERALDLFKENKKHFPNTSLESVYIVAVLHDLSKCMSYIPAKEGNYKFTYNREFKEEHDVWTLAQANSHGICLTYDEMMGILQAHGGWSKIKDPVNKLASIIHCADMISSQVIKR